MKAELLLLTNMANKLLKAYMEAEFQKASAPADDPGLLSISRLFKTDVGSGSEK